MNRIMNYLKDNLYVLIPITAITFLVKSLTSDNIVKSGIYLNLSGLSICVGLLVQIIPEFIKQKKENKPYKGNVFFIVVLLVPSLYLSHNIVNHIKDIPLYEKGEYEVITGYPENPSFYTTKDGSSFLQKLEVNDVTLRGFNMTKEKYEDLLEGRKVTFYYLYNQHTVVNWEYTD